MKTFKEYILNEETPPAAPAAAAPPGPSPMGGSSPLGNAPMGGSPLGGMGGGMGGMGADPMGGMGGMGADPSAAPKSPPIKIQSLNVWDVLNKILDGKPLEKKKDENPDIQRSSPPPTQEKQ